MIIKSRYQPKLICYLVVEERPRHLDFDPPSSTQTGIQEARGWIQLCQVVQESYAFRDPPVSPSDTLLLSPLTSLHSTTQWRWIFRSVRTGGITTGSDTVSSSRLSTNPIIGSSDHERLETLDGHHCLFSKHQDDRAISLPHSTDDSCYHWMKKTWIPGLPQTTLIRLFWHMRWWWSNLITSKQTTFLSHIMCGSETWFWSSLGVPLPVLVGPLQHYSCRNSRFDPYGDHLQTCQKHLLSE